MANAQSDKNDSHTVSMDVAEENVQDAQTRDAAGNDDSGSDGKKIKQLTLRLPEEYHRKLKILAACSGKSMTEILVGCIDERLEHCLERELKNVK